MSKNIKWVLGHLGGAIPYLAERLDRGYEAFDDCRKNISKPPTDYLKQIYFDTVVFTPHQLVELVRLFGADRIVMGTDYPFDMADYDPVGHVLSAGFDEATTAAIVGGNARRLLGL